MIFLETNCFCVWMATNIDRLKQQLPVTLKKHIVPGGEPRTYRLEIESQRIHLL